MGGWMTYGRMRHRNGLEWRPDASSQSPYPCQSHEPPSLAESRSHLLVGDLNRVPAGRQRPRSGVRRRVFRESR